MDEDFNAPPQDMGSRAARYQYSHHGDPDLVTKFPMALGFDMLNGDECLPRSFSVSEDPGIDSDYISGFFLAPSMKSESGIACLGPISDYIGRADDPLYLSSNLEDQSALFLLDNTSEMLPTPPLDHQSFSVLSPSGLGYIDHPVSEPMHNEDDLESSKVVTRTYLPETPVTSSPEDPVAVANKGQKRKHTTAKASSHSKHKLDSMMTCFPTNQGQAKVGRSKTAYSPPRRKEVELARKVGSCSRCRFRKVKASYL
jgi:hypothetical protein